MLANAGFCINLSSPPLAIICWAICIIIGLFIMLARSGIPAPAPPPPKFLSISGIPPSPELALAAGASASKSGASLSSGTMRASAFFSPDLRDAFEGSSSTPRRKAEAASLKCPRQYCACLLGVLTGYFIACANTCSCSPESMVRLDETGVNLDGFLRVKYCFFMLFLTRMCRGAVRIIYRIRGIKSNGFCVRGNSFVVLLH